MDAKPVGRQPIAEESTHPTRDIYKGEKCIFKDENFYKCFLYNVVKLTITTKGIN